KAMCDQWMAVRKLALTIEQFHQLPRHPAYKYEYIDGMAWLSPRPKFYHALLDLAALAERPLEGASAPKGLRPLRATDWDKLIPVFAAAFRELEPFGGLEDDKRREAAHKSLEYTRTGGDGPFVEQASFVATGGDKRDLLGAILVTLIPDTDLTGWDGYHW